MNDDARLVLGDELLAAGEPLGELVAVQGALTKAPEDHELLARERQLLRLHEERWFGELAPEMRARDLVDYGWRLGFLDSLTLRTASPRFHRDVTTSVASRFLRRVVVDLRDCPADQQRTIDGSLADLVAPELEELELRPHQVTRHPTRSVIECARRSPRLTSLTVWLRGDGNGDVHADDPYELPALLEACPNLVHLTLRHATTRALEIIAASSTLPRLRTLDVARGSIDEVSAPERLSKLEILRIGDNRLSDGAAERLVKALGQRVELGTQHPDSEVAARRERFRAIVDRVITEENEYEAWDHDFTPNPHAPWAIMQNELAVPEAVPFLVERLDADPTERRWVAEALEHLGPVAVAASDALVQRNLVDCLGSIDPQRARALRVDRARATRSKICRELKDTPRELARHLRLLLDDDDPEVVAFALGGGGTDQSFLAHLLEEELDLVPIGLVRMLLGHENAEVHGAAGAVLATLHLPEDAERVIAHIASGRRQRAYVSAWLGSHDHSDQMLTQPLAIEDLFGIVRRRRGAGLATSPDTLRQRLIDALTIPHEFPHTRNVQHWFASRLVRELRLAELAPFIARAMGSHAYDDMLEALRACGEAGLAAIDEALFTAKGDHARHLDFARDAIRQGREWRPTLADADREFAAGNLDDTLLYDTPAYGKYSTVSFHDPTSAHAAFQMAWIERGFGCAMTKRRIDWLRSLGVAEDLLTDLARRPRRIMPGRPVGKRPSRPDPRRAAMALEADLPSEAALYFPFESVEDLAARRAAEAHLERVRAGCPR